MSKKTPNEKTPSKDTNNQRLELTEDELGQIQGGNGNGHWCADGRGGQEAGGDDNGSGHDR